MLCLWSVSAQAAEWYEAYDQGVAAFRKGDLEAAESKFLESKKLAAAANRQPGRRTLRYGHLRTPFLPDSYLAQIYLQQAQQAQDQAEKARLVSKANASMALATNGQVGAGDPEFKPFLETVTLIAGLVLETTGKPIETPPTGGGGRGGAGGGEDPPKDPYAPVRTATQQRLNEGTAALDKQEWSAALSALEAADKQLTHAPSTVKGEFAQ